ncbi:MAG: cyclic-di-AMP receptor [Miniphocaeibacter sp.]|uniref:cyclic-di-AMP receptor n=1 Tax=Miniphocaeibacter sp. TaxID=3100973 RepID=UPI001802B215|nr:hypothetical protein [Gallicola sp.]
MKLIIAIVQDQDLYLLREDLAKNNFRMTKLSSSGGFLKIGNSTLLIGVEDERVEECLKIIEEDCKARTADSSLLNITMPTDSYMPYPVEVTIGGATVFILDVEEYHRF